MVLSSVNRQYYPATQTVPGLMSAADKAKSDALATNSSTQSVGAGSVATYLSYKLGVFHHFNMATFLSQDLATGSEAVNTFAPTGGQINVTQWVTSDVAAGAKYAILTAKHVDGFCLWPSAQTTHDIASTTWYTNNGNQNIAQSFITAAHNAGIKAGFYFSIDDLNWKAANPGYTSTQYTNFVIAQIQELAAYAPDILWFDQWQAPPGFATVVYPTVMAAIRTALPNTLVVVNNTGNYNPGVANQFDTLHGDVVGWEVDAGGMPPPNNVLPGEACETATSSGNWFWHSPGPSYRTSVSIATDQVTANTRNANLLINFPPNQGGTLDSAAVSVLSGLPIALAGVAPAATSLAVPSVTLQPNQFLRGPVSGAAALAIAGYLVDADLQIPGLHVALTNISNTFQGPQNIQQLSSDNIGAILNLQKRGQLGSSQGAVLSSSFLGQIVAQGWDGSSYGVGPNLNFFTTENWATGKHGSQLQLALVKTGTTTQSIHTFDNDGTVYFAGGAIVFSNGGGLFNNLLTIQKANGVANPSVQVTNGTMTVKMQCLDGFQGIAGTQSNDDFGLYTNNTLRLTLSKTGGLGFFGAAAVAKPTITGAKGGNTAIASLLSALVSLGLVTDSTSA